MVDRILACYHTSFDRDKFSDSIGATFIRFGQELLSEGKNTYFDYNFTQYSETLSHFSHHENSGNIFTIF